MFPIIITFSVIIFASDLRFPFYLSYRIGKNGHAFRFYKLRSMVSNADKTGVDSTQANDPRITKIGKIVRRYKIDELLQFMCVVMGTMNIVGPRPNVKREVDLYTIEERRLLLRKPGVTSISSIVFSDLGNILEGSDDPDIAYNQLVRPWKNRLDLFYIDNRNMFFDISVVLATLLTIFSQKKALFIVTLILKKMGASKKLLLVSQRCEDLYPYPPPGADEIVTSR